MVYDTWQPLLMVAVAMLLCNIVLVSSKYSAYDDIALSNLTVLHDLAASNNANFRKQPRGPVLLSLNNDNVASSSDYGQQAADKVHAISDLILLHLSQKTPANLTYGSPITPASPQRNTTNHTPPLRTHDVRETLIKLQRRSGRRPQPHTPVVAPTLSQLTSEAWGLLVDLINGLFNGEAVSLFTQSCPSIGRSDVDINEPLVALRRLTVQLIKQGTLRQLLGQLWPSLQSRGPDNEQHGHQLLRRLRVLVMVAGDAVQTWLTRQLTQRDQLLAEKLLLQSQHRLLQAAGGWQMFEADTTADNTPSASSTHDLMSKRRLWHAQDGQQGRCWPVTPRRGLKRILYASSLSWLLRSLIPRVPAAQHTLDYHTVNVDRILCELPLVWVTAGRCDSL